MAANFIAERKGVDVQEIEIPVIGGHAGKSILPLLSQVSPAVEFTQQEKEGLTVRIQDGGTEVVLAKDGAGSATLSMAMAGAEFAEGCIEAINGGDVTMCAYVESDVTSVPYFSTPLHIGADGINSALRQQLVGDGAPRDAGRTIWRSIIPYDSELLTSGGYTTIDVSCFGFERVLRGEPIYEQNIV